MKEPDVHNIHRRGMLTGTSKQVTNHMTIIHNDADEKVANMHKKTDTVAVVLVQFAYLPLVTRLTR